MNLSSGHIRVEAAMTKAEQWIIVLTDDEAPTVERQQVLAEMRDALRGEDEDACKQALWTIQNVSMEAAELREDLVRLWQAPNRSKFIDGFRPLVYALARIGEVPTLIEALGDQVHARHLRRIVPAALRWLGPAAAEAAPALVETLRADGQRHEAVEALRAIGAAAVPSLHAALSDSSALLRARALRVLGFIGAAARAALPATASALDDPEPNVRAQAAFALGQWKSLPETVFCKLMRLLTDSDNVVRFEVRRTLRDLGPEAAAATPTLLSFLTTDAIEDLDEDEHDVRIDLVEILGAIGPAAAEEAGGCLHAILANPREPAEVRIAAALAVWRVCDDASTASAALREMTPMEILPQRRAWLEKANAPQVIWNDEEQRAAERGLAAQQALFSMGSAAGDCTEKLIAALMDKDDRHRQKAMRALPDLVCDRNVIVPILHDLLDGCKERSGLAARLRLHAVFALARLRGDMAAAVPELIATLAGTARPCFQTAADYLGEIGPTAGDAVPHLVHLARFDVNGYTRMSALKALDRIDPKAADLVRERSMPMLDNYGELANQLFASCGPLWSDTPVVARINCIGIPMVPALMQKIMNPGTSAGRLGDVLFCLHDPLREAVVIEIAEHITNLESEARRRVVQSLYLHRPLTWQDASVRKVIDSLLGLARGDDPHLCGVLEWQLASMGERAVKDLIKASADSSPQRRLMAARALGAIGSTDCLPVLLRMIEDPDDCVCAETPMALMKAAQQCSSRQLGELARKEDANPEARCRAAELLKMNQATIRQSHPVPWRLYIDESWPTRTRRWAALLNGPSIYGGGESLRLLLEGMQDADDPRRCEYARAIGEFGNALMLFHYDDEGNEVPMREACVAALHEGLQHGPPDFRLACAHALGKLRPAMAASVDLLVKALEDESIRVTAAYALGEMGPWAKAAVPALLAFVEQTKQRYHLKGLAQIDPSAAVPALAEHLHQRNDAIPFYLAEIDDEAAIKHLWIAQDSLDRKTCEAAEELIPRIATRSLKVLPALLALYRERREHDDPIKWDRLVSFVRRLITGVDVAAVYGSHLRDEDWSTLRAMNLP